MEILEAADSMFAWRDVRVSFVKNKILKSSKKTEQKTDAVFLVFCSLNEYFFLGQLETLSSVLAEISLCK